MLALCACYAQAGAIPSSTTFDTPRGDAGTLALNVMEEILSKVVLDKAG